MVENIILLQKIILSLAIGALIGLEREWRARGEVVAGVRTFMLVCLFGLLSGFIAEIVGSMIVVLISLFSVGILTVAGYVLRVKKTKTIGFTTEIAFLLTFTIGLINYFESYPYFFTVALGILLAFILVSKETLHGFAKHLTRKELWNAVIFAIIVFIILPLLPNKPIDPFGVLNPYLVWIAMILVLSVSFVGYVAMKMFGVKKGTALIGLFGGLATSNGVTVAMAEKVRTNPKMLHLATVAISLAVSTMYLKAWLITSVINYKVGAALALPIFTMALTGYALSYYIWRKNGRTPKIGIGSPLELKTALKFIILFIAILFVFKLSQSYFGQKGIYATAFITGLTDIEPVVISLSSLAAISPATATSGIVLAVMANTISKLFIVHWLGARRMVPQLIKIFSVLLLVGAVILLVLIRI